MRLDVDEDGWDTEITKVITANDAEELHPARDDRGPSGSPTRNLDPPSQGEELDGIHGTALPRTRLVPVCAPARLTERR